MRILKKLTPVLQPLYRKYFSAERKFRYQDISIKVLPGVFYPGFTFSTRIFLDFIEKIDLKDKSLLEIGGGSGILSLLAAKKGAHVTVTDINPLAVENMITNARSNHIEFTVILSDLFENVTVQSFDYILIAPPYYPKKPANHAEMAWYCGEDHEYFRRLFDGLTSFFHDSCNVLMIFSEDCDMEKIKNIAGTFGFRLDILHAERRLQEWNYICIVRSIGYL